MTRDFDRYIEFLRFSLDPKDTQVPNLVDYDWEGLLHFSRAMRIAGVVWQGIEKLGKNNPDGPSVEVLQTWKEVVEGIRNYSHSADGTTRVIYQNIRQHGFRAVILKGQGTAMNYPDWSLRMPGDIDVWLQKEGMADFQTASERRHNIEEIRKYCEKFTNNVSVDSTHVAKQIVGEILVDIHHRPTNFKNPFYNARMQKYFRSQAPRQFGNIVHLPNGAIFGKPTNDFCMVYQICHIFKSIKDIGLGLRRLIDYYYLLRVSTREEREKAASVLKKLGMKKLAQAVVWIEIEKFGLDPQYVVLPPDERRGKILYDIIRRGKKINGMKDYWRRWLLCTLNF